MSAVEAYPAMLLIGGEPLFRAGSALCLIRPISAMDYGLWTMDYRRDLLLGGDTRG